MSKKVKIRRALISVSDKNNLIPFAKKLRSYGVEILSTGGTLKALQKAKIKALAVDEFTGFPEMLDGRVKTLHPKIHGGLLYRRDLKAHKMQAKKHGIEPIDLVVVNLYPFEQVTSDPKVKTPVAIENIDIGGPSMLRSAAKNVASVTVVCDPSDYDAVLGEMKKNKGSVDEKLRLQLSQKVFARTAEYDRTIATFLKGRFGAESSDALPESLHTSFVKSSELRYGENPHQRAALYTAKGRAPRFEFKQHHGKELSFNNILDIEATLDILREFVKPAACVVKHNNPCGIAQNTKLDVAVGNAVDGDPLSAFGGIVGVNRKCDRASAKMALDKLGFFEVIVAPSFEPAAIKLLKARKNLRIIETGDLGNGGPYDMRFVKSGILLQDRDKPVASYIQALRKKLKVVTRKKLTPTEINALLFGWSCVKTVKSNAIVLTQKTQTVGIGAGQMSRVDSVFMACHKAGEKTWGSFLASDAFFPMPDAIEVASQNGIRAIIQPGGSIRDKDVIDACNRFGIAMVFTGERHFRH